MSLSASEIAAVVAELQPLVGSRVDAVRVHAERALTLELHGPAGPATLLVSAEPELTRLHLTGQRPPPPDQPYPLQALLRREVEGARLAAIQATPGDRLVTLRLEKGPEPLQLVAELTGRRGNLFLVGADGRIHAGAGRQLSSPHRRMPGEPYLAPAPRPFDPNAEVRSRFPLPSPVPAPVLRGNLPAGLPSGAARDRERESTRFPLSAAIDAHYRVLEEERALEVERRRLRDPIRATLARARRTLEKLEEEAARVPAAEADRRAGDLIKANLHALRRGSREAVVTEYTSEGPRQTRLRLDPALGPRENMERYYRRCRRIVESAARVAEHAREVRGREQALLALLPIVERAGPEELPRIEREARRLGVGLRPAAPPRRRREAPPPPFRRFRSLSGAPILAGRGAAENDQLTARFARGNDLWLHVRGRTGAHVVLRLERGQGPDQDSLLDAAHVAAHFSDARGESAPEVVYTRAKYVKKPRGAAPGAVIYSQERALVLRLEPLRLERLLGSESEEPP